MVRHVRAPFILNQLLEAGEAGSTRLNLLRMPQSESGACTAHAGRARKSGVVSARRPATLDLGEGGPWKKPLGTCWALMFTVMNGC